MNSAIETKSPRRRRRSSSRGAAFIEATLAISLFLLLWLGVLYVGDLAQAQSKARAHARSCAWRIAQSGCEVIPDECRATTGDGPAPGKSKLRRLSGKSSRGQSEAQRKSDEAVQRAIRGSFFKRVDARASQSIRRPAAFTPASSEPHHEAVDSSRSERQAIAARYGLPCNTKPQGLGGLMKDVASDFF